MCVAPRSSSASSGVRSRPAGCSILTVPFAARWHFVPQDFWRFTPSGLEHLLTGAGFRDVRVYARGGALAVAGYKVLGLNFSDARRRWAPRDRRRLSRAVGVALLPVGAVAVVLGNAGISEWRVAPGRRRTRWAIRFWRR